MTRSHIGVNELGDWNGEGPDPYDEARDIAIAREAQALRDAVRSHDTYHRPIDETALVYGVSPVALARAIEAAGL